MSLALPLPASGPAVPVFALLDDALAPPDAPRSRLYTAWRHEHRCTDPAQLDALWRQVEADQRAGLHAVLLADYEWGETLAGLAPAVGAGASPNPPALRVLMFEQMQRLNSEACVHWLAQAEGATEPAPAAVVQAQADVDEAGFSQSIEAIREAIRQGQTYQVNYTYRWQAQLAGSPLALYRRLRAVQPVAFGALIALPPQAGVQPWVLSLSPELFLRVDEATGLVHAQPMKGTAPRPPGPPDAQADAIAAQALAQDVKNRAENLMIVDLLRNDLGRIARIGSVRVPALFEVQTLPTLFQMTSSVCAEPQPDVDVPALLRATFPCGSITGAPKRRTMELIRQLEHSPRGLYCGAIGWVDAPLPGRRLAPLCLSVAIRTLTLEQTQAASSGLPALPPAAQVRWGVGGGIVLDSQPASEWAETHWKARFVFRADPGFELIETLRLEADGTLALRDGHLARLRRSAAALGWPLDETRFQQCLDERAATLARGQVWRLRLTLDFNGHIQLTHAPLPALLAGLDAGVMSHSHPADPGKGCVTLGRATLILPQTPSPLACHKTTVRAHYDAAIRQAEQQGHFDQLFFNTAGEVVEGGRCNLLVKLAGRWFTPPVASGALPGVMRAAILADPAWQASERRLTEADLRSAEALCVCNALRGCIPARLVGAPDVISEPR